MNAAGDTGLTVAVILLTAGAIAVGSMVVLHLLPTGLSPLRHAVSRYGLTRYRAGYRVLTVSLGVAGLAAAAGVEHEFRAGGRPAAAIVALVLFGVARTAISWFPMDTPGQGRTQRGARHVGLALVAFGSITIAAFQLHEVVGWYERARGVSISAYADTLQWASWLLLAACAAMVLTRRLPALRPWFGLVERLIYLGTFIVLISTGIELA